MKQIPKMYPILGNFFFEKTWLHKTTQVLSQACFIWTDRASSYLNLVVSRRPSFIWTDRVSSKPSYISTEVYLVDQLLSGQTEFYLDWLISRPIYISSTKFFWTDRVSSRPSYISSTKFYLNRPSFISTELYLDRI